MSARRAVFSALAVLILTNTFFACEPAVEQHGVNGVENNAFFVNCNSNYVMLDSNIYFIDSFSSASNPILLRCLDTDTGECFSLCGRPDCLHNNKDCSAYIGMGSRLFQSDERLYWISGMPTKQASSELYTMDTDGGNRREVLPIDHDLDLLTFGRGTAELYGDSLYICGTAQSIRNGEPVYTQAVFSQPLRGGNPKLIYSSEGYGDIFGRVCEGSLYFAQTELRANYDPQNDKQPVLQIFKYDIKSDQLIQLCTDERPDGFYKYLFASDKGLYLGGCGIAAKYDFEGEELSVIAYGSSQVDIGESYAFLWETRKDCSVINMNGEKLFTATYPLDGMELLPFGQLFIGSTGTKVYYNTCFMPEDMSRQTWAITELDLETREFSILWSTD